MELDNCPSSVDIPMTKTWELIHVCVWHERKVWQRIEEKVIHTHMYSSSIHIIVIFLLISYTHTRSQALALISHTHKRLGIGAMASAFHWNYHVIDSSPRISLSKKNGVKTAYQSPLLDPTKVGVSCSRYNLLNYTQWMGLAFTTSSKEKCQFSYSSMATICNVLKTYPMKITFMTSHSFPLKSSFYWFLDTLNQFIEMQTLL